MSEENNFNQMETEVMKTETVPETEPVEVVEAEAEIVNQDASQTATELAQSENAGTKIIFANEPNVKYCRHCGNAILEGYGYCSACGVSVDNENIRYCTKCGTVLELNQKFCTGCGATTELSKFNTRKKKNGKIAIIITSAILAIALLIGVGSIVFPKIFVSTETLMSQGEYEKAFERANKDKKQGVLWENAVAVTCADFKTRLKNPDSFELREIWIDEENNRIFLHYNATNGYGGSIPGYTYYYWSEDNKEYTFFDAVQDFDQEEYSRYDDFADKLEKNISNSAKKTIREAVTDDSLKIDKSMVQRINTLNEQGILESVTLLEQVYTMEHPNDEADDNSSEV